MAELKMLKPKKPNFKEIFKGPIPGERRSKVNTWFNNNPEALAVVEEWLAMRIRRETEWGAKSIVAMLREHYHYPFTNEGSIMKWIKGYRPEQYARGIQRPES